MRGIAGLVIANSSLLAASLVYMGYAYIEALWGYFHLNPLDLGVGIVEYVLRSLSLFSPDLVFAAVTLIAVTAVRAWDLNLTKFTARADKAMAHVLSPFPRLASSGAIRKLRTSRGLLIATGMTLTLTGLALALLAHYIYISTYLLLSLLGTGPLILTWPSRAHRHARPWYALAIIAGAVCALWAGSLYAHNRGIRAAQSMVRQLPAREAVAVYGAQRLAMSGPGVTEQNLGTAYRYQYVYEGLRLLTVRSGTYYLLPVGWTPRLSFTYILDDSDQIRIELYPGEQIVR